MTRLTCLLTLTLLLTVDYSAFGEASEVPKRIASIVEAWPSDSESGDLFVKTIMEEVEFLNTWLEFVPNGLANLVQKNAGTTGRNRRAHSLLYVYLEKRGGSTIRLSRESRYQMFREFFVQAGAILSEGKQGFTLLYSSPESGHAFLLKVSPYGEPDNFALWWPTDLGSRAIEVFFYPNGEPHFLGSWENSKPFGLQILWEATGDKHTLFGPNLYMGDPRFYLDRDLPVISPDHFAIVSPNTDIITLSFLAPDRQAEDHALFHPRPRELPFLSLPNAEILPAAPDLPGWTFMTWSRNGTPMAESGIRSGNEWKNGLTAHYDGGIEISDPQLKDAVYDILEIDATESLTLSSLGSITELDLSNLAIKSVLGLRHFTALKKLDISDNLLEEWKLVGNGESIRKNFNSEPDTSIRSPLVRLILLMQVPPAPPLEELILDGNRIKYFRELPFLPLLKHLSLDRMQFESLPSFFGQQELESLSVADNLITELREPPALPSLRELDLSGNQLSSLDAWAGKEWTIPGLRINLAGNPLTESTLEDTLPVLKKRGITIITSQRKIAIGDDADPDGDGYSNDDERRFVKLFSANEEEIEAQYLEAIKDPEIPRFYLSAIPDAVQSFSPGSLSIDSIPLRTIQIDIRGKGKMYPGAGTHSFALYVIHDDYTWDYNTLEFTPMAAPGWQVEKRRTFTDEDPFKVTLSPGIRNTVRVSFGPGPLAFEVSPTEAIIKFVEKYFPGEDILTFDKNDADSRYFRDKETVYELVPNGLPDMAEATLLELILQNPNYDEQMRGSDYNHNGFRKVWIDNLAQARQDLKGRDDLPKWAREVVAVYATIGQDGIGLAKILKGTFNVDIDTKRYERNFNRLFDPDKGLYFTSRHNGVYWERVTEERPVDLQTFRMFAESVIAGEK